MGGGCLGISSSLDQSTKRPYRNTATINAAPQVSAFTAFKLCVEKPNLLMAGQPALARGVLAFTKFALRPFGTWATRSCKCFRPKPRLSKHPRKLIVEDNPFEKDLAAAIQQKVWDFGLSSSIPQYEPSASTTAPLLFQRHSQKECLFDEKGLYPSRRRRRSMI